MTDQQIQSLVTDFPGVYRRAREDWSVFRATDEQGAFSNAERQYVMDWYAQFGRLWEGVRPNWQYDPSLAPHEEQPDHPLADPAKLAFLHEVDAWVGQLDIEHYGLGLGPVLIAGILIAGALATATGITWAIGYIKQQNNVSEIIAGVASGVLPPEAISEIRAEAGGLAATLQSATTLIVVGALLYFGWPLLERWSDRG